jgi:hypothetical protein
VKNFIDQSPQMNSNLKDLKNELDFMRFRKFFLLELTKQLIKHSSSADMSKLQTILEKEKTGKIQGMQDTRERIKEKIRVREEQISAKFDESKIEGTRSILRPVIGMFEAQKNPEVNLFKDTFKREHYLPPPKQTIMLASLTRPNPKTTQIQQQRNDYNDPFKKLGLWIPDSRFPPHIQYVKPTPINKEIDLGKLNAFVNDSRVMVIECYGPEENLTVKGGMGVKKTGIVLTKEEIDDIIQRFSKESKIPVQEGIFKVVVGKLILTAIISETVGSKFVIKKVVPEQTNQPNQGA